MLPSFDPSALIEAARAVRRRAHAPYSGFQVGAALLTDDGAIVAGCNVESASYGLTLCAERAAVARAIAEGRRGFVAIAVVADGPTPVPPCGACRQVLFELAPELVVYSATLTGPPQVTTVRDLLPAAFDAGFLERARGAQS